jgi:hypothetical protein
MVKIIYFKYSYLIWGTRWGTLLFFCSLWDFIEFSIRAISVLRFINK